MSSCKLISCVSWCDSLRLRPDPMANSIHKRQGRGTRGCSWRAVEGFRFVSGLFVHSELAVFFRDGDGLVVTQVIGTDHKILHGVVVHPHHELAVRPIEVDIDHVLPSCFDYGEVWFVYRMGYLHLQGEGSLVVDFRRRHRHREQLCDCNGTWIHKFITTRVRRPALTQKKTDQVFLIVTDRVPARASVMLVIWSLRRHTLTKIPLENLTSHFIASPLPSQYKLSVVSFFRFLRLTAVLYMPEHVLNMQISKIWKGGNLSSKPHLSINSIRWHFLPLLLHLNLKEANWYNFLMQSYFIHSQGGFVWTDPKTWVVSTFGIQGAMWWEAPYQLNVDETCWAS